jgi:excinuclease UvrABC nuclease subunit
MALTKEISTSKIELVDLSNTPIVQVRESTKILEDGVAISESFRRYTIQQGADYSAEPAIVRSVCDAIWT